MKGLQKSWMYWMTLSRAFTIILDKSVASDILSTSQRLQLCIHSTEKITCTAFLPKIMLGSEHVSSFLSCIEHIVYMKSIKIWWELDNVSSCQLIRAIWRLYVSFSTVILFSDNGVSLNRFVNITWPNAYASCRLEPWEHTSSLSESFELEGV